MCNDMDFMSQPFLLNDYSDIVICFLKHFVFLALVTLELLSSSVPPTFYISLKTAWPQLKDSKYTVCPNVAEKRGEGLEERKDEEKGTVRCRKLEWEFRIMFKACPDATPRLCKAQQKKR